MSEEHTAETITVAAVSLGCAKNRIDTEEILGLLGLHNFIITDDTGIADVVIVNTCSFIEEAQQESVDAILQAARPRRGRRPVVIAAGCLAEHFGAGLLDRLPELAGVIGVHSYREIAALIRRCLGGSREALKSPPAVRYRSPGPRLLTTASHSVFVKIAEGCNNRCRYCLIPSLRGPYRSRPANDIVDEVRELASRGAQEINLVAQDTTAYGHDLAGAPDLAGLLEELLKNAPGVNWFRILYAYPSRVTGALVKLIAREARICSYLDLPMQHVSDPVLHQMGRLYSKEELLSLLAALRGAIPGLALRTTYLAGFPGETHRQFLELLDFMQRHPFERVGVFAYSRQEGTAAACLSKQVPRRAGEKRRRELMAVQQEISRRLNRRLLGQRLPVLVERRAGGGRHYALYFGRTEYQAPAVDGGIFFRGAPGIVPGQWVSVRVSAVSPYDLLGKHPVHLT